MRFKGKHASPREISWVEADTVFNRSAQANERKYVGEIHAKLLGYRTDGTRDAFLYNFRAREGIWYNLAA